MTAIATGALSASEHSAALRKAVVAAIAIYIAACAVVSLMSASLMPDYTGKDISAEYDAGVRTAGA
jgi:hypothetical protein